jgi:hypothetical protein
MSFFTAEEEALLLRGALLLIIPFAIIYEELKLVVRGGYNKYTNYNNYGRGNCQALIVYFWHFRTIVVW